jgi:formate--tetrahydrofolate ligase
VASELMAIFCLAVDVDDLKKRINEIIVAYSNTNKPIYVSDLGITNAVFKILSNAI